MLLDWGLSLAFTFTPIRTHTLTPTFAAISSFNVDKKCDPFSTRTSDPISQIEIVRKSLSIGSKRILVGSTNSTLIVIIAAGEIRVYFHIEVYLEITSQFRQECEDHEKLEPRPVSTFLSDLISQLANFFPAMLRVNIHAEERFEHVLF